MPAQPADHAGSLGHEMLPMLDEEADFTFGPIEVRERQVGLTKSSSCDCERVDRVAFAERAGGVAGVRHQLRRHSDDRLPGSEQITLRAAREVSAVLDRPTSFSEASGPGDKLEMVARGRPACPLRELAPLLVDRNGVAALVRVDPDGHHTAVSPSDSEGLVRDRSAGRSQ